MPFFNEETKSYRITSNTHPLNSRAIAWVDEPLLQEAHKRLPPAGLYYPVDEQASSEGRWQEQAKEALDECGYAYFLPLDHTTPEENVHEVHDDAPIGAHNEGPQVGSDRSPSDVLVRVLDAKNTTESDNYGTASNSAACARVRGPLRKRRPATSKTRGWGTRSLRRAAAERDELEQSHGLSSELKHAVRVARSTLKEGDRVESRWRRPTRLDKPRVDPNAWHPGHLVAVHKDGTVDVVFEDGGGEERLSGTPAKHVRLAPQLEQFQSVSSSKTVCKRGDPSPLPKNSKAVCKRVDPPPSVHLCPASRRKLAHIGVATASLRCTWEDPIPFGQELTRLRKLKGEQLRCRPEWRGSFPAVDFRATKNFPFGCTKAGAPARDGWETRQRLRAQSTARRRGRRRSTTSSATLGVVSAEFEMTQEDRRKASESGETRDDSALGRGDKTLGGGDSALGGAPCPALVEAQSSLVAAAMAYDKCVAEVRQCLERGAAAFVVARTYSEQQRAFEEATAALGPAQPARAGYTDWRGSPVVGLQNATLDVVEAMNAWATEWTAAKNGDSADDIDRERSSQGDVEEIPAYEAPPFMWEGLPLVSTIIGHSASIVAGASELRQWYGPGFPSERNPFFLAYPIDDRPVTPRDVLVRAYVNGEVREW